jgi:hypothetical protein
MLVPDENGRIRDATTGTTAIRGRWFAAIDADVCRKKGKHAAGECSLFVTPDPLAPSFRPTGDFGMCATGVAAKAIPGPDGNPDWKNIWGARIGLTLNDGEPYDATAHGVTGLAFHVDSEPPPNAGLRVQVTGHRNGNENENENEPPLWGGAKAEISPVHVGGNEVRWTDVGGPPYIENPPALDPRHLISIVFSVPTAPAGAKSFSFCINQLAALTN